MIFKRAEGGGRKGFTHAASVLMHVDLLSSMKWMPAMIDKSEQDCEFLKRKMTCAQRDNYNANEFRHACLLVRRK
jgi:hypothetical protein